jgi:hypothetical protein
MKPERTDVCSAPSTLFVCVGVRPLCMFITPGPRSGRDCLSAGLWAAFESRDLFVVDIYISRVAFAFVLCLRLRWMSSHLSVGPLCLLCCLVYLV